MRLRLFLVIMFALSFFLMVSNAAAEPNVTISNVTVESSVFNPTSGEMVQILFYLSRDAEIIVKIFDPDGHPVCTVAEKRLCYKGTSTVFWNGKDEKGDIVADDAYCFIIEAKDKDGFTAIYDPTSFSGGEEIRLAASDDPGGISYNLPKDARVSIRIGIHNGPLLKTVVDWAPRKVGRHTEAWDGKDESGVLDVRGLQYDVHIQAFALSENALITSGSGKDLVAYKLRSSKRAALAGRTYDLRPEERKRLFLKADQGKARVRAQGRHPHYSMVRAMDRSPRFKVKVNNPLRTVRAAQGLSLIHI